MRVALLAAAFLLCACQGGVRAPASMARVMAGAEPRPAASDAPTIPVVPTRIVAEYYKISDG